MENKNEITKPLWMQMVGRGIKKDDSKVIEDLLSTNKIFIEESSKIKKRDWTKLKEFINYPINLRMPYSEDLEEEIGNRRFTPVSLGFPFDKLDMDITMDFNDSVKSICSAFKVSPEVIEHSIQIPEIEYFETPTTYGFRTVNSVTSKNKNMDNEKLKTAIHLEKDIVDLKNTIERTELTTGFYEAEFNGKFCGSVRVAPRFINFSNLKKNVLTAMRKELKRMETEFAKL